MPPARITRALIQKWGGSFSPSHPKHRVMNPTNTAIAPTKLSTFHVFAGLWPDGRGSGFQPLNRKSVEPEPSSSASEFFGPESVMAAPSLALRVGTIGLVRCPVYPFSGSVMLRGFSAAVSSASLTSTSLSFFFSAPALIFSRTDRDRLADLERFLGDGGGRVVADERIETGDHRHRPFHLLLARTAVGFHFQRRKVDESLSARGQQVDAFQNRQAHDRHHNVELELAARRSGKGQALIVADDAGADLHHRSRT